MQQTPVIEIQGLNKWFGDQHVLRGIDMAIRPSDVVCVIGASIAAGYLASPKTQPSQTHKKGQK